MKLCFEITTDWLTLNLGLSPGLQPSVEHCAGAVSHNLMTLFASSLLLCYTAAYHT